MNDAVLQPVAIKELRPTQVTIGLREVAQKREQWRKHAGDDLAAFLSRHILPTVLGPKQHHYLTDAHHLACAAAAEGVDTIMVSVAADLSGLARTSFWIYLDNRSWCHPYDQKGVRRGFEAIPKSLADLKDDPFRSLASSLRRAGGFAKDTTPFSEFLWADFLRAHIKPEVVEHDFADALVVALGLSKSEEAGYLPGWCGPDPVN